MTDLPVWFEERLKELREQDRKYEERYQAAMERSRRSLAEMDKKLEPLVASYRQDCIERGIAFAPPKFMMSKYKYLRSPSDEYEPPIRKADVPVSQEMLFTVRDELKAELNGLGHRMDVVETNLKHEISTLDQKIDRVEARIDRLEVKVGALDAKIGQKIDQKIDQLSRKMDSLINALLGSAAETKAQMEAKYHQAHLMVEEQKAHNAFVIDKCNNLSDTFTDLKRRQDQLEKDWSEYTRPLPKT